MINSNSSEFEAEMKMGKKERGTKKPTLLRKRVPVKPKI